MNKKKRFRSQKQILALLIAAVLLLSACGENQPAPTVPDATEAAEHRYTPITAIDHCVVEPDEREAMTDSDRVQYRALMDAMLTRQDRVTLDISEDRANFLLELLKESPYYFFTQSVRKEGTSISFTYAYSAEEQQEMLTFMDVSLLKLANSDAQPDDNELDVILKVYHAVGMSLRYDDARDDNKQLGSPLFDYPADEVYKSLRDGRGLCYGFAYVLRYVLLQRGIDAFCVYGECRAHDMGHEWVILCYDDRYFCCDPAWDRAADQETKLLHFGKTDAERTADTLVPRDFAEYHEAGYPQVVCDDGRFSIFRGIISYTVEGDHRYTLMDRDGEVFLFDSQTIEITPQSP